MCTTPSILDVEPVKPRNPFAPGAVLPGSVDTVNSSYEITLHALRTDAPATCTVTCVRGTFEGHWWDVPVSEVALTRDAFVAGGLRTTKPVYVNGLPVSTWTEGDR